MDDSEELMDMDSPQGKEIMEVCFPLGSKNKLGKTLSRGEKSRIAAKRRRDEENHWLQELIRELPVAEDILLKLDKAALIKLAVCYIKLKTFVQKDMMTFGNKSLTCANRIASPSNADKDLEGKEGQMMLEALNGFLIYVNKKCSIKFVSVTIKEHLGLAQENLIGKKVLDIVHVSDQNELVKQFRENDGAKASDRCTETILFEDEPQRVFYVRMKYNLPKPGNKTKHTGYMLVQWTGKMKKHVSSKSGTVVLDGLLCVCRPMQTTSLLEVRMDGNMFMSRHDLGMTFTFCDTRIITLIGYEPNEVVGKTAYHFHNPIDALKVKACHQNLIVKGASVSKYYRFMGKNNNWVWLQTRATIIYSTANKAQYIVCMNYVISEEEGEKYLMLEEHQQANSHTENKILTLPDNIHYPQAVCNLGPRIVELDEENLEKTACLNGELDGPCNAVTVNDGQFAQLSGTDYNFESRIMGQLPPNANEYQSAGISQEITTCNPQPIPQQPENSSFIDPLLCASSPDSCAIVYCDSTCPSSVETYIASPLEDQLKDGYADDAAASSSNHSVVDDAGYDSAASPYLSSMYFSPATVSPACNSDSASIERGYFSDSSSGPQGLIKGETINFGLAYSASSGMSNPNLLQRDNSMNDGNADLINAETILNQLLWSFSQQQNSQNSFDANMAAEFSTIENLTSHSPPVLFSTATSTCAESTITNVLQVMPAVSNAAIDTVSKLTVNTVNKQSVKKIDKPLLRSFLTMPEDDIPRKPLGFLQSSSNNPSKTVTKDIKSLSKDLSVKQVDLGAQRFLNLQNPTLTQKSFENSSSADMISDQPVNSSAIIDESLDLCEMPEDISEFALQYLDNVTDAQSKAIMAELENDTFMDTSEIDLTNDFLNTLNTENVTSPIFNQVTCSDSNLANGVMFSSQSNGQNCSNTVGKFDRTNSQTLNLDWNIDISLLPVNGKCGSPMMLSQDHGYHQSLGRLNEQNKSQHHKVTEYLGSCPVTLSNGVTSSAFCDSQTQTPIKSMSLLECHLRKGIEETRKISKDMCNSSKPFLQKLLTGELTNDMYIRMESDRLCKDNGILPK